MTQERKLSRRAFLAGTAALGASIALSGCAEQKTLEESTPAGQAGVEAGTVEVRHAWCQMCGPAKTACSTLCYIKDGRWVNVEGNPDAGNNWGRGSRSLCAKGNAAMQVPYDPTRILYP
ncbi:MAG: twin-arginine translocation signal domain-containing protein, partial [Eggerthellaceae bacterium]|nr:twin-arginine translocation signal domain-containing protein [Eggerthellaceae bacterium]